MNVTVEIMWDGCLPSIVVIDLSGTVIFPNIKKVCTLYVLWCLHSCVRVCMQCKCVCVRVYEFMCVNLIVFECFRLLVSTHSLLHAEGLCVCMVSCICAFAYA